MRMAGGGAFDDLSPPPIFNPGLRKGVSHEEMLMGSNLMRTTQRVTFSPKLERHQSEETYLDVGSLAGSLDFSDVLGGGMREDLVASAKTGLELRRERRKEEQAQKKDRNHELSKTATESYKMHLEEEVKVPKLRGENVKVKSPKKTSPGGGHVSHHAELPTQNWESKFTREALLKEVTENDWRGALHRDRTVSQAVIAKAVPEDVRGEFAQSSSKEERKLAEKARRERSLQRKAEWETAEKKRRKEEKEMEKKLRESQTRLRSKTGEFVKGMGMGEGKAGGWK